MTPSEARREVLKDLGRFTHDPYGFVMWAFPWGGPGTILEKETGPDVWQEEQQKSVAARLKADPFTPILDATASGHGPGKSAEVAWLALWALMTRENTRGVVTANTEGQLRTKTWAELSKWYGLLLKPLRDLFKLEATSIHSTQPGKDRTWRIDMIPWSLHNTEAFQGLHNAGERLILIFDEASAIADPIWDVSEGATTDKETEILWFAYGNPTRNTGRFKEVVEGRLRHLWTSRKIDVRNVKRTNKARLEGWRLAYGEDSDFFRIRVRGEFPRASSTQFIATDLVDRARRRQPVVLSSDPMILGVDVARFGDDRSVICPRQGRDARTAEWTVIQGLDTMQVAAKVVEQARMLFADAVFIDEGGIGAGVLDRVRQIGIRPGVLVQGVQFGGRGGVVNLLSGDSVKVVNMAAGMWAQARDWLQLGAIPDDEELSTDLTGREYGFNTDMAIQLEKKSDMKKRGLASPDKADALGLTFAYPVTARVVGIINRTRSAELPYDPFADLRAMR